MRSGESTRVLHRRKAMIKLRKGGSDNGSATRPQQTKEIGKITYPRQPGRIQERSNVRTREAQALSNDKMEKKETYFNQKDLQQKM